MTPEEYRNKVWDVMQEIITDQITELRCIEKYSYDTIEDEIELVADLKILTAKYFRMAKRIAAYAGNAEKSLRKTRKDLKDEQC